MIDVSSCGYVACNEHADLTHYTFGATFQLEALWGVWVFDLSSGSAGNKEQVDRGLTRGTPPRGPLTRPVTLPCSTTWMQILR